MPLSDSIARSPILSSDEQSDASQIFSTALPDGMHYLDPCFPKLESTHPQEGRAFGEFYATNRMSCARIGICHNDGCACSLDAVRKIDIFVLCDSAETASVHPCFRDRQNPAYCCQQRTNSHTHFSGLSSSIPLLY